MHRARWWILASFLACLAVVGYYYHRRLQEIGKISPENVAKPSSAVEAEAQAWRRIHAEAANLAIELEASKYQVIREGKQLRLFTVRLLLRRKDGSGYNYIAADQATYDAETGELYSEGPVEIRINQTEASPAAPAEIALWTTRLRVHVATGRLSTEATVKFQFRGGQGVAEGATYDPGYRELQTLGPTFLKWEQYGARREPLTVAAGKMTYKELDLDVYLDDGCYLTHGDLQLWGARGFAHFQRDYLEKVEAWQAYGTYQLTGSTAYFQTAHLTVFNNESGLPRTIVGESDTLLRTLDSTGRVELKAYRAQFDFAQTGSNLHVTQIFTNGQVRVVWYPAATVQDSSTVLKLESEVVVFKMRPGESRIRQIETGAPGVLRVEPASSSPDKPVRVLIAERFWLRYSEQGSPDQLRAFRTEVFTYYEDAQPSVSRSQDLVAKLNQAIEVETLEQWGNFSYQQGDLRVFAGKAISELQTATTRLHDGIALRDGTMFLTAKQAVLNQQTGDLTAQFDVRLRATGHDKAGVSEERAAFGGFSAVSQQMETAQNREKILLRRDAFLWNQGFELRASEIVIDRRSQEIQASGDVLNVYKWKVDGDHQTNQPAQASSGSAEPVQVRAGAMTFHWDKNEAFYRDKVHLITSRFSIQSQQLHLIFSSTESAEQQLQAAVAAGGVYVEIASADGVRKARAEQAVYRPEADELVLTGGKTELYEPGRGWTRGERVIYHIAQDRLEVVGKTGQPAVTLIERLR